MLCLLKTPTCLWSSAAGTGVSDKCNDKGLINTDLYGVIVASQYRDFYNSTINVSAFFCLFV